MSATNRCGLCGRLTNWCNCWKAEAVQHNDPGDETPALPPAKASIPAAPTGNVWSDERGDLWAHGCPCCGGVRVSESRDDGLAWCFACNFTVTPNKVRL